MVIRTSWAVVGRVDNPPRLANDCSPFACLRSSYLRLLLRSCVGILPAKGVGPPCWRVAGAVPPRRDRWATGGCLPGQPDREVGVYGVCPRPSSYGGCVCANGDPAVGDDPDDACRAVSVSQVAWRAG